MINDKLFKYYQYFNLFFSSKLYIPLNTKSLLFIHEKIQKLQNQSEKNDKKLQKIKEFNIKLNKKLKKLKKILN